MARSQNGWTAGNTSLLAWFKVPGTNVSLRLRKDYAGPLLILFAQLVSQRVEKLVDPGCWSYAYRPVRGSTSGLSNHASGTAIDMNAPRHPLGKRGTYTAAQSKEIRRLISLTGGALRWGGDYRGRADEMHVELNTTSIALVQHAIQRLQQELQR